MKAALDLKVSFVYDFPSGILLFIFAKEYVDKGVQVQNLSWHVCSSVFDCERLMDKGNRNRATGATLMNKDSSRSHSIFTIVTEMCSKSETDGKEHIRAGKLNLVDLAGSERQSKTRKVLRFFKNIEIYSYLLSSRC